MIQTSTRLAKICLWFVCAMATACTRGTETGNPEGHRDGVEGQVIYRLQSWAGDGLGDAEGSHLDGARALQAAPDAPPFRWRVDHVWLASPAARFTPTGCQASAGQGEATARVAPLGVVDLAREPQPARPFSRVASNPCGFEIEVAPAEDANLPENAPESLLGASVLVEAHDEAGQRWIYRSGDAGTLRFASRERNLRLRAPREHLVVNVDLRELLARMELVAPERTELPREIRVIDALKHATTLHRDENLDGIVQPEELARLLGSSSQPGSDEMASASSPTAHCLEEARKQCSRAACVEQELVSAGRPRRELRVRGDELYWLEWEAEQPPQVMQLTLGDSRPRAILGPLPDVSVPGLAMHPDGALVVSDLSVPPPPTEASQTVVALHHYTETSTGFRTTLTWLDVQADEVSNVALQSDGRFVYGADLRGVWRIAWERLRVGGSAAVERLVDVGAGATEVYLDSLNAGFLTYRANPDSPGGAYAYQLHLATRQVRRGPPITRNNRLETLLAGRQGDVYYVGGSINEPPGERVLRRVGPDGPQLTLFGRDVSERAMLEGTGWRGKSLWFHDTFYLTTLRRDDDVYRTDGIMAIDSVSNCNRWYPAAIVPSTRTKDFAVSPPWLYWIRPDDAIARQRL